MTRGLLLVAATALVLGLIALLTVDRETYLDKAIGRMDDQRSFTTSAKSAETVARISDQLRTDGSKCRTQNDAPAKCAAVLSASAYTAVAAVTLLDCTAPDIFDMRLALEAFLRRLRTFIDGGAKGAAPSLPEVITC